jgi:carbamoyl-phosphate synthase large subunit
VVSPAKSKVLRIRNIVQMEAQLEAVGPALLSNPNIGLLCEAKKLGFTDYTISTLTGLPEKEIRTQRKAAGIVPTYKIVDTCAAEFEAQTPYFYSCYDTESEG